MEYQHIPVMLKEVLEGLNIKPDGIYVDCTLGGAGHSKEILRCLSTGKLIGFDQDQYAIDRAKIELSKISNNYQIIKSNFVNIKNELINIGINKVDGILYDLGVSSFQFDIGERGFSYNQDAILDMRMNQDQSLTAFEVVNTYSENSLKNLFYQYGEEKFAPSIARLIVKMREQTPIKTTNDLVEIIKKALPASELRKQHHPAKKVFQAIRIEVNNELKVLKESLQDAFTLLNPNGRICVISFQSLEDRIVKQMFKEKVTLELPKGLPFIPEYMKIEYNLISKKAIIPKEEELLINKRSHSAKLRIIEKLF